MVVYFDSSAIVKLVMDEPGRELAVTLTEMATTSATARLTYPECHAALAAAARARRLDQPGLQAALAKVRTFDERTNLIDLDQALGREAGRLAERHALRGYDAVHLATALTLQRPRHPVIFATWDRRLHQAAFDAGLTPAPAVL